MIRSRQNYLLAATLVCLLATPQGRSFIDYQFQPRQLVEQSSLVLHGIVVACDSRSMTVGKLKVLKGNLQGDHQTIQVDLSAGNRADFKLVSDLLKSGSRIVWFQQGGQSGRTDEAMAYIRGVWLRIKWDGAKESRWHFVEINGKLLQTYEGSSVNLIRLVRDIKADQEYYPVEAGMRFHEVKLAQKMGPICGVSCADYNQDGQLDLFLCSLQGSRLYRNDGKMRFHEVPLPEDGPVKARTASWADFNSDGYPDLLLSDGSIFANHRGQFTKEVSASNPREAKLGFAATWIDYNNDGLPEPLISTSAGLVLLHNTGQHSRRFQEATGDAGLPRPTRAEPGFVVPWDIDGDGGTDFVKGTDLYRNTGEGRFSLISARDSGLSYEAPPGLLPGLAFFNSCGHYASGAACGLFVPQEAGRSKLFQFRAGWCFADVLGETAELRTKVLNRPRSCAFGDFNADGYLDVYTATAQGDEGAQAYIYRGYGTFLLVTEEVKLPALEAARGGGTGLAFADLDNDGDLDLLVGREDGDAYILANSLNERSPSLLYLKVKLAGTHGVLGARVSLYDTNGRMLATQQHQGATNLGSQGPPEAYFGILEPGEFSVEVRFSDGVTLKREAAVEEKGLTLNVGAGENRGSSRNHK